MIYLSILENSEVKRIPMEKVDFSRSCDVLCIGVGAAGSYAAMAAAREGVSVIALERDENIGGMPVNGRVVGYYYGARGGSFEELDREALERQALFAGARGETPDLRQTIMTEYFDRYGVDLIGGATVTGVYFEDDRAVGVRVWVDGQYKNIHSKMLIDATSDGYIIRMCHVETYFGRPLDGKAVPFTVRTEFLDDDDVVRYDNGDSGYCDQYRAAPYSQKILTAHAAAAGAIRKGKTFLSVAPVCGVREGVRFLGEQTLCYEDIIMDRAPEKVLFYAYSDLDKHGHDLALDEELFQNWWCVSNLATVTVNIPVPLGVVVPRGLRGMVTAGRCLSVDSYASSAVRMNRDMYRLGECVGIACAQAVTEDCDFMNIDYDCYVKRAEHFDCFAGEREKHFGFHFPGKNKPYTPVDFHMDAEEILQRLGTDCPGAAIWSCFRYGDDALAERLIEALDDKESEHLRKNAAIALGIMGRRESLSTLRELVMDRDCFYYQDCRRSNQFRSAIAICLLGRLGDREDIRLLSEIVLKDEEFQKPLYHTLAPDYRYCGLTECRYVLFQHFTHAAMAMVKLAERFGVSLADTFEARFTGESRDRIIAAITSRPPTAAFYGEIWDFMEYVRKRSRKNA